VATLSGCDFLDTNIKHRPNNPMIPEMDSNAVHVCFAPNASVMRLLVLCLALPICGMAFLNSIPKRPLIQVRTPLQPPNSQDGINLRWLPSAGSPLQQFSSPFTPKHTEKSKGKSDPQTADDSANPTQTDIHDDDYKNTTNVGNTTAQANSINNLTASTTKHPSESPLFGQHFHYPYVFQNKSMNMTSGRGNVTVSKNQTSITSYYGSLFETYFPFLQQAPSTNTALKFPSKSKKYTEDASVKLLNAMAVLQDRKENDTITVSDLRTVLSQALLATQQSSSVPYGARNYDGLSSPTQPGIKMAPTTTASTTKRRPSSQVAFPQPSILSYKDVQRGTTFVGGILGLILGTTILPNLWLVGMLLGAMYGYEITKEPVVMDPSEPPQEPNMVAKRLISLGRKIARAFLQTYDQWKTLWFLYKTGQLSYEYYKRYEMLDQRFEIQNKVDAWNRRFAEGKKRFDAWEQENEVGRTILAGLRTVWLVDEQSKRRTREKSRYRLVQVLYDAKHYIKLWMRKFQTWAKSFFQEGGLQGVISNLRDDLTNGDSAGARVGAALAAVMVVNIGGALFSISPVFSNLLAIVTAVLWPSRALDLLSRIRNTDSTSNAMSLTPDFMRRYDRNRYHFFDRSDGTKRYYRTGQSMVSSRQKQKGKSSLARGSSSFNAFWNPRPADSKERKEKAWWNVFQKSTK
jgi:hypothetical protein